MTPPRIAKTMPQRARKPDPKRAAHHLSFVRSLACIVCGLTPPSQAAHVRRGTDGGTGTKPHDRYTLPLCIAHHAEQHRVGELTFYSSLGIDPLDAALRLWTVSGDLLAGQRIVFRGKQRIRFNSDDNRRMPTA